MIYDFNILLKFHPGMTGTVAAWKTFQIKTQVRIVSSATPERGRRQIPSNNENINNVLFFGGLLNCLFKVYVFMVCRTR